MSGRPLANELVQGVVGGIKGGKVQLVEARDAEMILEAAVVWG